MASGTNFRTVVTSWTPTALAGTQRVGQREQPDRSEPHEGGEQARASERRPEHGQVADEGDGDRGVAGPGGDPVAPRGLEADEVTERPSRVGVGAAGAREGAPEVREDEREQDRTDAGEGPRQHRDRPCGGGE